jgi:hypothetical protein
MSTAGIFLMSAGAAWKLLPSAARSSPAKEAREPAADTCVQTENRAAADIFF